jgi:hypothetical protein
MISLMALVLCAGVLFNSVPANAAPVQWSVESGGNGHWYEAVYTGSPTSYISWDDAKAGAEAPGGYLACITSKEENTFVFNLITDPKFWYNDINNYCEGPWLGGHDATGHSDWQWISGELWSYSNWESHQPSSPGSEFCLNYVGHGSNNIADTWNDLLGGPQTLGYVVEYNVPEPSTLALLGAGAISLLAYVWRRRKPAA